MFYRLFIILAILYSPISFSNDIVTCSKGENIREVRLLYLEMVNSAPCKVIYEKKTERPGHEQTIWKSQVSLNACESKMNNFVKKLGSWGYECQSLHQATNTPSIQDISPEVTQENIPSDHQIAGDYPETSLYYLSFADLLDKNVYEIRLMRSEIYARHGYIFPYPILQAHFDSKDWYQATTQDPSTDLSEIEIFNANLLHDLEEYYMHQP